MVLRVATILLLLPVFLLYLFLIAGPTTAKSWVYNYASAGAEGVKAVGNQSVIVTCLPGQWPGTGCYHDVSDNEISEQNHERILIFPKSGINLANQMGNVRGGIEIEAPAGAKIRSAELELCVYRDMSYGQTKYTVRGEEVGGDIVQPFLGGDSTACAYRDLASGRKKSIVIDDLDHTSLYLLVISNDLCQEEPGPDCSQCPESCLTGSPSYTGVVVLKAALTLETEESMTPDIPIIPPLIVPSVPEAQVTPPPPSVTPCNPKTSYREGNACKRIKTVRTAVSVKGKTCGKAARRACVAKRRANTRLSLKTKGAPSGAKGTVLVYRLIRGKYRVIRRTEIRARTKNTAIKTNASGTYKVVVKINKTAKTRAATSKPLFIKVKSR